MSVQLAVISEWHFVLLALIVFLLFGGKKLPELARGVGEALGDHVGVGLNHAHRGRRAYQRRRRTAEQGTRIARHRSRRGREQ